MNSEINPQVYARAGGLLYLFIIALGFLEEVFIRGRTVVGGDAAATFANLQKMEGLWRIGIAMELVLLILFIGRRWLASAPAPSGLRP